VANPVSTVDKAGIAVLRITVGRNAYVKEISRCQLFAAKVSTNQVSLEWAIINL
jgi:hypothetical protein